LNTMSLLPIFASSIKSLQAMYRISFMCVRFAPVLRVFVGFSDDVFGANSLRHENTY
jgi:hypothetical protein